MGQVRSKTGRNIAALRVEKGLSQASLAERAKLSTRTVQRAESGRSIRGNGVSAIAAALGVDASVLQGPLSIDEARAVAAEASCHHCGAQLVLRVAVPHEFGDDELDVFECGAEVGARTRPCPKDPQFPQFDDYTLDSVEDAGRVWVRAHGKTAAARAVELEYGVARTFGVAAKWVERSYIGARYGHAEAERFFAAAEYVQEQNRTSERRRRGRPNDLSHGEKA